MSETQATARVSDLIQIMEDWAPAWTAQDWDRVGLLLGEPGAPAAKVWTALELGPGILGQALAQGVQMLLLHHPPLFSSLERLRTDDPATARLLRAAQAGLALFAAHTNLDAAPGGVNDALAARLGLVQTRPFAPAGAGGQVKLVVFAPPEAMEPVSRALFGAGGGRIGDYRDCSFVGQGLGAYLAPPDGRPYLGSPGRHQQVEELRLEVILPRGRLAPALAALREVHPYQEPAFDVYPLAQPPAGFGLGRVGRLAAPQDGRAFAARAAAELGAGWAHVAGALPPKLERVAVVAGSGGDLLPQAAQAGAQVLVTGEARHHAAQQAADLGLGLICLGHYQTEAVIVEPWAQRLAQATAARGLHCTVTPWTAGEDPWRPVS
ncbi:MAG: Nif3-like dinuclear metal center hexameric protein [Desulfarculus sp.]|nr:MAG: Nif3-like dinuclear metal center hexameric protein [Desulfarculus sp.]